MPWRKFFVDALYPVESKAFPCCSELRLPTEVRPQYRSSSDHPSYKHHIYFLVPCGVPLSIYPIPFFGFFTYSPPLSCRRGDYTMTSSSPLLEAPSTPSHTPSRERARKRGAYDPHHAQDGSPSQIGSQNLSVLWDSTSALA